MIARDPLVPVRWNVRCRCCGARRSVLGTPQSVAVQLVAMGWHSTRRGHVCSASCLTQTLARRDD